LKPGTIGGDSKMANGKSFLRMDIQIIPDLQFSGLAYRKV